MQSQPAGRTETEILLSVLLRAELASLQATEQATMKPQTEEKKKSINLRFELCPELRFINISEFFIKNKPHYEPPGFGSAAQSHLFSLLSPRPHNPKSQYW